jgi:phospholipid/cholesterol/gamma-HCH transport system substrate-binding protein
LNSWVTPFKVGLVMIGALIATVMMLARVNSDALGENDGYRLYARIADASGLAVKSRVVLAGIEVGLVEGVELDGPQAMIRMRVKPEVTLYAGETFKDGDGVLRLKDAVTLAKRRTSLVGAFYLELTPGLRGKRLADGDEITVVISEASPNAIVDKMNVIAGDVEGITRDVKKVTSNMATVFGNEENAKQMQRVIDDTAKSVEVLRSLLTANQAAMGRIVSNTDATAASMRTMVEQTSRDTAHIMADIAVITNDLRGIVSRSSGEVDAGLASVKGTLASAQEALDRINYSLENVQRVTERLDRGEGTIGKLINDPTISDQATQLVTTANGFVQRVTDLKTEVEFRSGYGAQDEAFKSVVGIVLRPDRDKFYNLEIVSDPRGTTSTTTSLRGTDDPTETPIVLESKKQTTDRLELSFTLGHRWPVMPSRSLLLGGRFGLIEGTGGIGANLWTWNDHLELRADLFDFEAAEHPRLRTWGLWSVGAVVPPNAIWSHIFVHGGVDDWMNTRSTDYFGGLGIAFDDRDLKAILLAAPTPSL